MFIRATRYIFISAFLLLALAISCKGPFTYETHPVIWISAFEFTFSASEVGPNPTPQVLKIRNSGIETLNYDITDDMTWLTVTPTSGSSSGQTNEHLINIDKTGMASRDEPYVATVKIVSLQACNSPQNVTVNLNLGKEPPAEISVNPRDLSFAASTSGGNPPPQTIRVKNSGQGTLNYTITDDANWLEVSPTSGSSTGGENAHQVSVNASGLNTGTYTATISVSDPNAVNNPQTVSVTLEVSTALPPLIAVTPDNLTFNAVIGQGNPSSQNIKVSNGGDQTLNYSITDNANWLSVSPTSGSSSGQEKSHTVSVSITGLAKGTYNANITISSSNATNSPQVVGVTLNLSEMPTNNQIAISCSPTSGKTGATIDVPITILGNTKEIKAFGLEVTFDATMFEYVSVSKGALTGNWASITGNLVSTGRVRIGGFAGDPSNAVSIGSSGSIVVLKLRVTCSGCNDGKQSQVCMSNFTDDIVGMTPAPGCATFTYKK